MSEDYLLRRLTVRQQYSHEQVLESDRVCDHLRRKHEQHEQALESRRVSGHI